MAAPPRLAAASNAVEHWMQCRDRIPGDTTEVKVDPEAFDADNADTVKGERVAAAGPNGSIGWVAEE